MKSFLSSTYVDLIEYRQVATEALERLGQHVGRMEIFGARPVEPSEACLSEIEDCDLFVGVYAHRYGYIPDGSILSITEAEFRHARKLNKPIFCFVVEANHPWPPEMIENEPGRAKLIALKAALSSSLVRDTFSTPENLAYKIATSIGRYLAQSSSPLLPPPCLQLSADLLGGAAEITGAGQSGGTRHTLWQLWLELYLVPVERVPATIPIHRITGMLEISGLHSEGFDDVSLETTYKIPPDILRLLHGRSNRPKQTPIINPMPVLLIAYCQTLEWELSSQPHEDCIRVNLEVAEADYQPLEVVAPLRYLEYTGSTKWRVERH